MRSNQRGRIRKARAAAVRGARRTLYDCHERTGQRNVTAAVMTSKRLAIGRQRRVPRERARVASVRARGASRAANACGFCSSPPNATSPAKLPSYGTMAISRPFAPRQRTGMP